MEYDAGERSSFVIILIENRAKEVGVAAFDLRSASLHLSQYIETSSSYQNTKTLLHFYDPMAIIVPPNKLAPDSFVGVSELVDRFYSTIGKVILIRGCFDDTRVVLNFLCTLLSSGAVLVKNLAAKEPPALGLVSNYKQYYLCLAAAAATIKCVHNLEIIEPLHSTLWGTSNKKRSLFQTLLLVVNSVIALFRVDFTGRELAESQQKLSQMMSLLMNIPKEFNIAVYMTISALEVVPEVIADPGKWVFNGADARIGRQVNAGTVGGTSGTVGGGAGPGGGAGTGGVAGTDGGVSEPGGGVIGGAGTGGGVGDGGDGGGDDDDDDVAAADDDDEDEEEEEKEGAAAALLDNIPPNQDMLARIGGMRLYVKEFEAMVKGDEFQTEVLKFAADRNLLPHLLEGQQLDNIPNLRRHFLERTDFIKEALNIVETNIEFSDEEMELPTDEDFLVAEEIMVFAQAKRHVTDRAP